ncbi:MAG: TauD/TfdA family dioxygenase, partial [Campylobacterales bacterium]|nr:TauD/TfdA family dioxygenase [Campylobacterales bacterium]
MSIIRAASLNEALMEQIKEYYFQNRFAIIRGLELTPIKFETFTYHFCTQIYDVSSRYHMKPQEGDGLTSYAPIENIAVLAHSESSYVPYPPTPDIGFLMCLKAPQCKGGETSLGDGVKMLQKMPQTLSNRFKNEKIIYEYLWEPARYQAQFGVKNQEELVKLLDTIESIEYTLIGQNLHILYKTPAILTLPNGEQTFSNAILGHLPKIDHPNYKYPFVKATNQVYWESGEALSPQD